MPRCAGKKEDGSPCERIVGASQSYCYSHDPERAAEHRRNAFAESVQELEELSARHEVEADAEGAEEYLALMTEAWHRALKSA